MTSRAPFRDRSRPRRSPAGAVLLCCGFLLSPFSRLPGEDSPRPDQDLPRLREQLAATSAFERAAAAGALGRLNDRDSAPRLAACLDDENEQVQFAALGALLSLGAAEEAGRVERLLEHRSWRFRMLAADTLLSWNIESAMPAIVRLVARETREHATLLAQRIFLAGATGAGPELLKLLDPETPRDRRVLALLVLGNLEYLPAREKLEGLLEDPDSQIREAALLAAGLLDPQKHAARLREAFGKPELRDAMIPILARLQDGGAWDALRGTEATPRPQLLDLGNYWNDLAVCTRLKRTRFPLHELWHRPVTEVLERAGKVSGIPFQIAPSVLTRLRGATLGQNLGVIGSRPDLFSILSALNPQTLEGGVLQDRFYWIAEKGAVRIVEGAEAEAYWKGFRPGGVGPGT